MTQLTWHCGAPSNHESSKQHDHDAQTVKTEFFHHNVFLSGITIRKNIKSKCSSTTREIPFTCPLESPPFGCLFGRLTCSFMPVFILTFLKNSVYHKFQHLFRKQVRPNHWRAYFLLLYDTAKLRRQLLMRFSVFLRFFEKFSLSRPQSRRKPLSLLK
jgi:hypothetical protein